MYFRKPHDLGRMDFMVLCDGKRKMITKAEISMIRSLADKKSRIEYGMFVVEGRKMVSEALVSGFTVRRVLGTDDYAHIERCEVVGRKDIERMSSLKTPQGILALVEIPKFRMSEIPDDNLVLALDGVQDPGNFGTIMRIADWFGIKDIVCSPDSADCFGPKVVQASMGAVFRTRVHYGELVPILNGAIRKDIPVYGTFLEGDPIYDMSYDGNRGIVILGSEGNGIRADVASVVTRKLYIPPYPLGAHTSESLNVGVAAAIVCAEFRRRAMQHHAR